MFVVKFHSNPATKLRNTVACKTRANKRMLVDWTCYASILDTLTEEE